MDIYRYMSMKVVTRNVNPFRPLFWMKWVFYRRFLGGKMMKKIAFIGAGSMAEAIIVGMLRKQLVASEQIYVTNKSDIERLKNLKRTYDVITDVDKARVIKDANIVILSMKPQDVEEAVTDIKPFLTDDQLVISVIAGVSTERIQQLLEKEVPIIRAMPNTSASIGLSGTAISSGSLATTKHIEVAKQLFDTIGLTVIVDEKDMHIVTAISGSGPAYIYYLVEAMEEAAVAAGCDSKIANDLIVQMIKGASEMLKTSNKSAKQLREEITSPAGTTEAGLKTLATYNFQEALQACVNSARERSIELGKKI